MIRNLHTVDDDRGVSPVIGVILMVAITVILAAVIGAFVLGIGGDLATAPNAQINIQNDTTEAGNITITHNGGDAIPTDDLRITANGDTIGHTWSVNEFTVGDEEQVDLEQDGGDYAGEQTTVRLIHDPSDSILRTVDLVP